MTAQRAVEVERSNRMLAPRPAAPTAVEVSDLWINPSHPSNLLARVTVAIPRWGETIRGCSVVRTRAGGYFVLPPGIPMVGRDGTVLKDDAGKTRYAPAIVFTPDVGRRFSDAVLATLRRSNPEVFGETQDDGRVPRAGYALSRAHVCSIAHTAEDYRPRSTRQAGRHTGVRCR